MDQAKGFLKPWLDLPQPKKIQILKGIAFGCFSMFLLFVVIYGFGGTGKKSIVIPNVVVFMDAMPYNLQALRYLSKRRDIVVSMVVLTVNSWTTDETSAFKNTAAFMKLLRNEGYAATVPIYYGNNVALTDLNKGTQKATYSQYISTSLHTLANKVFGASSDLANVAVDDPTMTFFEDPLKTYLASNKATLLILGSCTDAAWFLQRNDGQRGSVNSIYVAGGAFNSAGDMQYVNATNKVAEVNFFMDPEAAAYIVGGTHGRDVMMFPIDSTRTWNTTSYQSIVTTPLGADRTTVTSAIIVAEGLNGYYNSVGFSSKRVAASVMAASYLADKYVQNGAEVALINVAVRYGGSMSVSGQSYHPPSGDFVVTVVLKVDESTFFDHLVRVGDLDY